MNFETDQKVGIKPFEQMFLANNFRQYMHVA